MTMMPVPVCLVYTWVLQQGHIAMVYGHGRELYYMDYRLILSPVRYMHACSVAGVFGVFLHTPLRY